AGRMLKEVEQYDRLARDPERVRLLKTFIQLYGGADNRYINYYGPPGTIPTIPYYQVLRLGEGLADSQINLNAKAVFLGLSENLPAEPKGSFYTVFSQTNGVFISGSDIAATALLNAFENTSVEAISLGSHILLLLAWGLLMGIIPRIAPMVVAGASVIALAG